LGIRNRSVVEESILSPLYTFNVYMSNVHILNIYMPNVYRQKEIEGPIAPGEAPDPPEPDRPR
jgi:hypothetical protein